MPARSMIIFTDAYRVDILNFFKIIMINKLIYYILVIVFVFSGCATNGPVVSIFGKTDEKVLYIKRTMHSISSGIYVPVYIDKKYIYYMQDPDDDRGLCITHDKKIITTFHVSNANKSYHNDIPERIFGPGINSPVGMVSLGLLKGGITLVYGNFFVGKPLPESYWDIVSWDKEVYDEIERW